MKVDLERYFRRCLWDRPGDAQARIRVEMRYSLVAVVDAEVERAFDIDVSWMIVGRVLKKKIDKL